MDINQNAVVPQAVPRWKAYLPLFCSVVGAVCLVIGCSAPSLRGLSGKALTDALEANGTVSLWPIPGFPLVISGFVGGAMEWRTWIGKASMLIAFASFVWFCLHQ